jgi:uncharacterized membrane protein
MHSTLLAALLSVALLLTACTQQPRYPAPPLSDGEVAIDIASLPMDVPQFYTLRHGSRNISFFVVRLATGVQSYFDACVTCYPKKLGYASEDGRVICRACSTSYSIHKLDKGVGGCYPIRMTGRTEGRTYRIPVATINAEAGKF